MVVCRNSLFTSIARSFLTVCHCHTIYLFHCLWTFWCIPEVNSKSPSLFSPGYLFFLGPSRLQFPTSLPVRYGHGFWPGPYEPPMYGPPWSFPSTRLEITSGWPWKPCVEDGRATKERNAGFLNHQQNENCSIETSHQEYPHWATMGIKNKPSLGQAPEISQVVVAAASFTFTNRVVFMFGNYEQCCYKQSWIHILLYIVCISAGYMLGRAAPRSKTM